MNERDFTRSLIPVDKPLISALVLLCSLSLIVLYSTGGEDLNLLSKQGARIGFAFFMMILFSRIQPSTLARWSPYVYLLGILLLIAVLVFGFTGKGARRWLDLWLFKFQPSEIMKLGVPMMVAWLVTRTVLPPNPAFILLAMLVVAVPTALIILQPDLGTAMLIAATGITVIFLAGISWRLIITVSILLIVSAPILWVYLLHEYQRQRILTLFNPWDDPLGAGYHTIQSIIAIGSGGLLGKGWIAGSQSQLEFIPERSTDFVFAVFAEEFGLIGVVGMILLYLFIVYRGLVIAYNSFDSYSRLLAGSLSITFFLYVFVNIGMVSGILPVVGVPLPLISYGGTSMVTLLIGFGMLMSINNQKFYISRPFPV